MIEKWYDEAHPFERIPTDILLCNSGLDRTIAACQATLKNEEGKLIAHGTETCAIFNPKP